MLDIVITIAIDETKYVKTCIKTGAPIVSNINITNIISGTWLVQFYCITTYKTTKYKFTN